MASKLRVYFGAAVALVAVAAEAGCAGTTSEQVKTTHSFAPSEYVIGVEDVVQVSVWREPELGVTAPVRPDGRITVPVVGEIGAAGRTARQLEAELAGKLAERVSSPVVNVVVKEINASRIFVLGEVAKPGMYPLRGALTVVQALAMAGGMTEFAGKSHILILRRTTAGQQRLTLDYEDALKSGPFELIPGDTVVVP
jgi:polysaccharide export outer membrane protein